jgi:predicted PurR-regulated permease PerM
MGISPLAALVSLYIGFKLLGFVGLFLGPALVILYDALRKVGIIQINFKL